MTQAHLFPKHAVMPLREFVIERLKGLAERQRDRTARRQHQNRLRQQRKTVRKEPKPTMRTIKVTYRSTFEQPTGVLNPMNLKVPGALDIEVFNVGEHWKVRELTTNRIFDRLGKFPSAEAAMKECAVVFARQPSAWHMWGTPPPSSVERLILPKEVMLLSLGKVAWKEPEDFTHILHAPAIPPDAKVPPAACGAKVPAKAFINNKANVEPTCEGCAQVWREHYKSK